LTRFRGGLGFQEGKGFESWGRRGKTIQGHEKKEGNKKKGIASMHVPRKIGGVVLEG